MKIVTSISALYISFVIIIIIIIIIIMRSCLSPVNVNLLLHLVNPPQSGKNICQVDLLALGPTRPRLNCVQNNCAVKRPKILFCMKISQTDETHRDQDSSH